VVLLKTGQMTLIVEHHNRLGREIVPDHNPIARFEGHAS